MSNWRRRDERRKEIAALNEEGAAAARAGKSVHACPQKYNNTTNAQHWQNGWEEERYRLKDLEEAAKPQPELAITAAWYREFLKALYARGVTPATVREAMDEATQTGITRACRALKSDD